ncbi:MAG TPA: aminopeptidase [Roseiflexaceae bacterium]|nr:aminopeptidase [Roseiflexaceae bacterium]
MTDPRLEKLADILVHYCAAVRPGDWVRVQADVLALPLAREVQRLVLRSGGYPTVHLSADELEETLLREASEEQLTWIAPIEPVLNDQIDVSIRIAATSNTRALTGIDPARQRLFQNARRDLRSAYMRRAAEGRLRWVLTQYPCSAYAQEADMSLREYEDFVYAATFADQPDPAKCWRDVHDTQQRLVDWLKGKKQVVVRGPNIAMTLSIEGRTFINSDGRRNMPSGEIFTGPLEDSANGWVKFTYPAIRGGQSVEGVEFEFEAGKVVRARAAKNEAYLLSQLDSDAGARYLGEFAIGTNYGIQRFTKSILYDEKIGGTLHMALGAGYPETGSVNQSSVHWDFICDMRQDSEILVDGELFYKNGQFQVS